MKLYIKLALAIFTISLAAVALVSFMNFAKYQNTYTTLLSSRFQVIAERIRANIENGLTLGFAVHQLVNVRQILVRFQADDPNITAIHAIDERGVILFSSDATVEESTMATDWLENLEGPAWYAEKDDQFQVGVPVTDNTGRIIGGVVVNYPQSLLAEPLSTMQQQLVTISLAVLIGSVMASAILVFLFFQRFFRSFQRMNRALRNLLDEGEATESPWPSHRSELEEHFFHFWETARLALRELRCAEAGKRPDYEAEYQRTKSALAAIDFTASDSTHVHRSR